MIVSFEEFDLRIAFKTSKYIRLIRRHDIRGEILYTDTYYEVVSPQSRFDLEPMFCIIRNMTAWENPQGYNRGAIFPLKFTRVMVGSAYRHSRLFRKENQDEGRTFISMLPVECNEMTSARSRGPEFAVSSAQLRTERRHLIPNVDERFSDPDFDIAHYINRSTRVAIEDIENAAIGTLVEEERGPQIKLNLWGIADCLEAYDWNVDDASEEIYSELSTHGEATLYTQLYYTRFVDDCKRSLPTENQKHPDDGLYLYSLNGRYVVYQYINHFHNDFQYDIIDVLASFIDTNRRISGAISDGYRKKGTGSDNLFEELTDYSLSSDILFR